MKLNGLADPELCLRRKTLNRSFLREGRTVVSLEAELPEADGAAPLNAYYRRLYRKLTDYCASQLVPALPEDRPPLELELDCRVPLLTPGYLSLSLELRRRDLPALPAARFGAVWSRVSGVPLPLRSFFPHPLRYRKKLGQWLRNQAMERLRSGYCLYDPRMAERADRLYSPDHFYADEKGLILFFPPLTLGSAAEGIPEFCLPWDEAGPRLPEN